MSRVWCRKDSPVPSTRNEMAQMSFSRYCLARNARTNRPSTESRSTSSCDSRRRSKYHQSRHHKSRSPQALFKS
ncbi:hypothetical protein TNCV_3718321 [Trichonephila clavipes]|nr:hypothetical protein TNCV_3718321 [Trichonephila clavipes]